MRDRYNGQNCYQDLGIEMVHPQTHPDGQLRGKPRKASQVPAKEIKDAWRKLVSEFHPDTILRKAEEQGLSSEARATFIENGEAKIRAANSAYDELKLQHKRTLYDAYHEVRFSGGSQARPGAGAQGVSPRGPSGANHSDYAAQARQHAQERARAAAESRARQAAQAAENLRAQQAAEAARQAHEAEAIRRAEAEAEAFRRSVRGRASAAAETVRGRWNAAVNTTQAGFGRVKDAWRTTPKEPLAQPIASSARETASAVHAGPGGRVATVIGVAAVGAVVYDAYRERQERKNDPVAKWLDRIQAQQQLQGQRQR